MQRLHILDGHGYIFRAHFGLMTAGRGDRRDIRLSNSEGMPTGALYVFSRMLLRMALDLKPRNVAVVFDAGRKSFRTEMYPAYKAHRPPTPEDLVIQMPYFRRVVEALGWPVLSIAGVEADDVIATLVHKARAIGSEALILSADKDLMQLIGDGVSMYDSLGQKTYHRDDVIAKFGVPPERVGDFLALVGDASDNIPGLEGVGEKTAAKLLAEYPSIDALIAANPTVPRIKVKHPFTDPVQLERLRLSRELVRLRTDVELGVELDALQAARPDDTALRALLGELEFTQLIDKFLDAGHGGSGSASPDQPVMEAPAMKVAAPKIASAPGSAVAVAAAGALSANSTAAHAVVALPGSAHAGVQGAFNFTGTEVAPLAPPDADSRGGTATAGSPHTNIVDDVDGVIALVAAVRQVGGCALVAVFDGARDDRMEPIGVALAHAGGAPAYLPINVLPAAARAPLAALLADAAVAKTCFDGKRLAKAFAHIDMPVAGLDDDAMIAAFIADPTSKAADPAAVFASVGAPALLDVTTLIPRGQHSVASLSAATVADALGPWAASLTTVTQALRAHLTPQGDALYRDIELPISRLLVEVERNGICIDGPYFAKLADEVGAQVVALEAQIHALAGEHFNVSSPKQLGRILFEKLKLTSERMKKTKTGFSTDADVLEAMVEDHPIVKLVLEQRELSKLKGTYLDALPPLLHPKTGRLHTTFNMVAAATGRLSSQDPNLQNIPIRSELGRKIRRGFIAAPGKVLIAADYSQIELRILAHLSGDPVLVRAFRDRVDVHTQTACEVFGITHDAVTAHHRRVAKAVNYGLIYGQSDFGLARALDIPRQQAAEYSARYFERFPSIRQYLASVVAQARQDGGTTTLLGRWRPIRDLSSKTQVARRAAERIAQNTPMQGAGADIMKLAMLRSHARLARENMGAIMLLTVHDELVFEAEPGVAQRVGQLVAEEMAGVIQLAVPLEVDVGIAANWADA
ncbi:MAG: DNA polymerase I [Kofleriaceae bacterium]|nr:DNA polymerase I [Kofleriaceae bacterium]